MTSRFKDLYLTSYNFPYGSFVQTASAPTSRRPSDNMSPAQKLDYFCRHYDAKYELTHKQYARYDYAHPDYFIDPRRADIMSRAHSSYYTVPMVEVTLPADQFDKIVNTYIDSSQMGVDFEMFEQMRAKESLEAYIRSKNPAVKKAYEKYSLLLHTVKDEYK